MATYFADTSFWTALSSRRDQYHSQAIAWHSVVLRTGSKIVTTEAVLWEWLNALADSATRVIAAEGYRRAYADSRVEVIPFEAELNGAALELYRSRADKDWSLTDCLSFVVMERHQLLEATDLLKVVIGAEFPCRLPEPADTKKAGSLRSRPFYWMLYDPLTRFASSRSCRRR